MAKETEIVNIINAKINLSLNDMRFTGKKLSGIVYSIIHDSQTNQKLSYPLINNEGIDIQFNDSDRIQIHHRHLSNTVTTDGDRMNDIADMRMYITALRSKVNLSNDALKDYICSSLAFKLSQAERTTLNISVGAVQFTGANMDSIRLYQQEYGKTLTRTDIIMIEVQYQIECRYSHACINNLCFN